MKAPEAKKKIKKLTIHGDTRKDPYYWLNDRKNRDVIEYLKAENKYTNEAFNVPTKELQAALYDEMVARIPQKEEDVPYFWNGYLYYNRFEEGGEYPLFCRKKTPEAAEEVMLDGNILAKPFAFFEITNWEVSPDNRYIAYAADTVSRRQYTVFIKDLETGKTLSEKIVNTSGDLAWANDSQTIFYAVLDDTLRAAEIFKHRLGGEQNNDTLIYKEDDATFEVSVAKSKSQQYIFISSESTISTEYRFLNADTPEGKWQVFHPREKNLEYHVTHQLDRFLIRTNYKAGNFRLMATTLEQTEKTFWQPLTKSKEDVFLDDFEEFATFTCLQERKNGLVYFRILPLQNEDNDSIIPFQETDYYAYFDDNFDYDSSFLRYSFTSLKTPGTIIDYDINTGKKTIRKSEKVIGGYDSEEYITERKYVPSRTGEDIPVSIIYKKGLQRDGKSPLLLYGYGSYGINVESVFRSWRISLLDRGFSFAVAHIRGGQELGRKWYEDGKLLKKKNTFNDFIDVSRHLISSKYTSAKSLFAMGGSAGGLLMGVIANEAPELYKGIIAAVPFVDVVTTMLDETIPLTTGEYDEWGNPNEEVYYRYMLSYSPYDNVKEQDYPAMLITTGLHDSQVQYWEPAKWTAKLRDKKTNDNPLYLWVEMDFGHGGASGRFEHLKEIAMDYAFLLTQSGKER